ncbi:MAG: PHP domain-containing protein [Myxococcota bacterium]|nr:PHP domain-containing protein [Myxococcota bacterium]
MRVIAKYPVDLHMHSIKSDGEMSPKALVQRAVSRSLKAIAITDHDTVAGVEEALEAAAEHELDIVPAIEVSAWLDREIHILGFFIDHTCPALAARLDALAANRQDRIREICDRLDEVGCPLDARTIIENAHGGVGRPHVAKAMVEAGYVKTFDDAFRRYLGSQGDAYVPAARLSAADAISLIHDANGVTSIAHPGPNQLEAKIPALKDVGLDAVEVGHPAHSATTQTQLRFIAAQHDLAITGGSDLHYRNGPCNLGQMGMTEQELDTLKTITV